MIEPITIKNKLKEINLGQLMAWGILIDIFHKYELDPKRKQTEEDNEAMEDTLAIITGESRNFIRSLSQQGKNSLIRTAKSHGVSIAKEVGLQYSVDFKSIGAIFHKVEIPKLEYFEMMELDEKAKGIFSWAAKYQKIRSNQQETLIIQRDLEKEPASIWTKVLDGMAKKIHANGDYIWRNWQYIPYIISAIAWKEGQSRFKKEFNGDLVVDWDLINKRAFRMAGMPAIDAIKAFNFFLTTPSIISVLKNLIQSSHQTKVKNLTTVKREKPLMQSTDGSDT